METETIKQKDVTAQRKRRKTSVITEGNSLRHIYGLFKGKISYDESILNLGKKRARV